MRDTMARQMSTRELLKAFDGALENGSIYAVYQPKINHATGRMIGAEALMRWNDPENGMQYPNDFIPVFEENGLISRADLHIFEDVCRFQRRCIDSGIHPVPISCNMSRYDVYKENYIDKIEKIREKYNVPVKYIHIEITESSAIGGMELVSNVLDRLHKCGYIVEMDDFGSGYSSLNVLKDLEVDMIKLDMRFLSGKIGGRGGTIISSIVRMTKWLNTPVIAEGVETLEQADYMKSIGCSYVQGYLYSKPVNEDEFIEKLGVITHEPVAAAMDLVSDLDIGKFWDPQSTETIVFNNFVGGAAIFSYQDGNIEYIRVNAKYMTEIGMNMTEKEFLESDPWECLDEENREIYENTIRRAMETNGEETCETWRGVCSKICGEGKICVRTFLRLIGRTEDQCVFYAVVKNITDEKRRYNALFTNEGRYRAAFEHANMYAWEYDISTKQMRPCFRCMRDLGFPPVLDNYPEPAIEQGVFPPEFADTYREWHRKMAEGAKSFEAIVPLTPARIPFYVRYTTEFDENGRPLKAYGSATLVVDK